MINLNWILIQQYLTKHLRTIGILTAIAAVLGVIVSLPAIMKPKYKSRVVFYPANITPYSKESETEQALQIMEASDIKNNVIAQFDLYKHYDIVPNKPASLFYMNGMYNENVSINKTGYEAVEVVVVDEDPQLAYDMTNAIVKFYNKKVKQLHEEKSNEVAALFLVQMQQQQHHIDSLAAINQNLRTQYGVLDYYIQVEQATKGAFNGNHSAEAQKLLTNLAKYGNESQSLSIQISRLRDENAKNTNLYFDALKERNNKFTYANIVVSPTKADKKHYPVRWLIVLSMALSTLLLSCVGAIAVEMRKQQ
jgi:capsular polysaccharide biosynthesis protein